MKFKAHINLTNKQKKSRPSGYGDPGKEASYFEFSIQYLIEQLTSDIYDADFTEVLIPWLMEGNQPEIEELDHANMLKLQNIVSRKLVDAGWTVKAGNSLMGLHYKERKMTKKIKNDYALRYEFKFDTNNGKGFRKDEIDNKASGYADAIVVCSILREGVAAHDGGTSHLFISHDGHNKGSAIPETELFNVWGSLAHRLWEHGCFGDERDKILIDTIKSLRIFTLGKERYEEIWGNKNENE